MTTRRSHWVTHRVSLANYATDRSRVAICILSAAADVALIIVIGNPRQRISANVADIRVVARRLATGPGLDVHAVEARMEGRGHEADLLVGDRVREVLNHQGKSPGIVGIGGGFRFCASKKNVAPAVPLVRRNRYSGSPVLPIIRKEPALQPLSQDALLLDPVEQSVVLGFESVGAEGEAEPPGRSAVVGASEGEERRGWWLLPLATAGGGSGALVLLLGHFLFV